MWNIILTDESGERIMYTRNALDDAQYNARILADCVAEQIGGGYDESADSFDFYIHDGRGTVVALYSVVQSQYRD